ncbi:MAG: hypothetical protein KY428_00040 [Bacteroidetes bacterium]|nr:hypothetical protein [Bacteroidota bacterium]
MANSALLIAMAQPGGAVGRALKAGIASTLANTHPEKASGKGFRKDRNEKNNQTRQW